MRKLIIYINKHYDEEMALYDLENDEVVLKGDHYHEKIPYVIEGYLYALEIDDEDVPREYIDKTHELFETLDFYLDE